MGPGGRAVIAVVVGLAVAAGPAAASADTTFCVNDPSCPSGGVPEAAIADAITAVNADPTTAHDTILIGPGTYLENPNLQDNGNRQVDIIGAVIGQTTIETSAGNNESTLLIDDAASTVRDLSIHVPGGNNNYGLNLAGSATRVAVAGDSGAVASNAILLGPVATLSSSTVYMPNPETGIHDDGGTVSDTNLTAGTGVNGVGTITRTRIVATTGIQSSALGTLTFDDSWIITIPGPTAETAISSSATDSFPSATMTVRHDTLIGDGSAGSIGIRCTATAVNPGSVFCSTTVDSSIIRGFQHSISRDAGGVGAAVANVSVDYSDMDPSGDSDVNTLGGTGSLTLGGHDLNVDPRFASTVFPLGYQLSTGSPMIDKGDPVLGSGESTTDLAGNPRVVAGRSGAPAISDMGAFEYQPHPPTVTATASASAAKVGAPITFSATTGDPDPGDSVSVVWHFDDGTSATGASVSHAFKTAGRHAATATATDLDGFSVTASVSVTVGGPVISGLTLKPPKFKAKRGTMVSYSDSQGGTATLTVLRHVTCPRRGHHAKKCKHWVPLKGTFQHSDAAGANSFRFKDRKLRPGRYELQVLASDSNGTSPPATVAFTIE